MIFERHFPEFVEVPDDYHEIYQFKTKDDFDNNEFIKRFTSDRNFQGIYICNFHHPDYKHMVYALNSDRHYILGFINNNQFNFEERDIHANL